ncbi:MAG: methylmalonyl-CoA mutase family protein, partial [Candidatus Dormibacteraeota bacterium]|nr:methylmalonyl-CoA mutase family protein [Candidatus Dormibacteraeota bacterium]
KSARIALRTQQLVAYESGAANTVDPFGGSYFMEDLTRQMEQGAEDYFRRIEEIGGVLPAIEAGFFQQEIADASFRYQAEMEQRQRVVVGVNDFTGGNEEDQLEILRISGEVETSQVERVQAVRERRDAATASRALEQLRRASRTPRGNLMPHLIECARAYCTEGEMMGAMVDAFGIYTERAII